MHCDLLLNHRSRAARHRADEVVAALRAHGFVIDRLYAISRQYPLERAVTSLKRRRPKLLIIGGGDGTVSSVIGRLAGVSMDIGVIPLGTTNNFARGLSLPFDIAESVAVIRDNEAKPVDLGRLNDMYFANVASIGVSAEIASHVTATAKRRWGRFAYLVTGMRRLLLHKPFVVTIRDVDQNLTIRLETHQVVVANGKYHAGSEISENATLDDGQLFVFALGGASRLSFLWHVADFYFGKRKEIVHHSYFTGKSLRITTDRRQDVEVDGEVKAYTPLAVSVAEAAVRVRHGG